MQSDLRQLSVVRVVGQFPALQPARGHFGDLQRPWHCRHVLVEGLTEDLQAGHCLPGHLTGRHSDTEGRGSKHQRVAGSLGLAVSDRQSDFTSSSNRQVVGGRLISRRRSTDRQPVNQQMLTSRQMYDQ